MDQPTQDLRPAGLAMNNKVNSEVWQPFTLRWSWEDGSLRITLKGELDLDGVARLADCIDTASAVSPRLDAVQVDLGELSFVDLGGLRGLAAACRKLQQVADAVQVSGASDQLLRLAQISHLTIPGLAEVGASRHRPDEIVSVASRPSAQRDPGDPSAKGWAARRHARHPS